MKFYSAVKKNKFRPSGTKWMEPKKMILREISHKVNDHYQMVVLIYRLGITNANKLEETNNNNKNNFWIQ